MNQALALDAEHPMYQPHLRRAPRTVAPARTASPEVIERHAVRMAHGEIGQREFLRWLWRDQRCFICDEFGECNHREPNVDLARAFALARASDRRGARSSSVRAPRQKGIHGTN